MVIAQVTYRDGLWNGRPVADWVDLVISDIAAAEHPERIVLFGSVARSEAGPDSDVDVLVVLGDRINGPRWRVAARIKRAITAPVPVDVLVTDVHAIRERRQLIGSAIDTALREGKVVYVRAS